MANAVRVAGDLLKWQAAVRHPQIYGERQRIEVDHTIDFAARLMEARARILDHDSKPAQPELDVSNLAASG